jgi:hypothetical protein
MKGVELYGRVRYSVQIEGLSHREAARQFGIDPRTVAKMVKFSVPPTQMVPVAGGFAGIGRMRTRAKRSGSTGRWALKLPRKPSLISYTNGA